MDEINEWIKTENEKRIREAEALKARMEREKQELRDFIEKDNKAMKERMSAEEAERQKKEREMAVSRLNFFELLQTNGKLHFATSGRGPIFLTSSQHASQFSF